MFLSGTGAPHLEIVTVRLNSRRRSPHTRCLYLLSCILFLFVCFLFSAGWIWAPLRQRWSCSCSESTWLEAKSRTPDGEAQLNRESCFPVPIGKSSLRPGHKTAAVGGTSTPPRSYCSPPPVRHPHRLGSWYTPSRLADGWDHGHISAHVLYFVTRSGPAQDCLRDGPPGSSIVPGRPLLAGR